MMELDAWVHANNPPPSPWAKAWWDYIDFVRRLADRHAVNDRQVVDTYTRTTPPPSFDLELPVVRLDGSHATLSLAWLLGAPGDPWALTVSTQQPPHTLYGLFDPTMDVRNAELGAAAAAGPYSVDASSFSCVVADEWDVAMVARLIGL